MINIKKDFLINFGSAEEMFVAYTEGNFTIEEEQIFDELLEENPLLSNSFIEFGANYADCVLDETSVPDELELQKVRGFREHFNINSILSSPQRHHLVKSLHSIEDLLVNTSGLGETSGSVGETAGGVGETAGSVGETTGGVGETAGSVGETAGSVGTVIAITGVLSHEMAEGPMQVGEAPINGYSSYVKQGYRDTCAINAQKIILDAYGKSYTEEQLIQQAIENGLYEEGKGTSLDHMGGLLELNGCPCTNYVFGNVADLTRALAEGKMVMMAVDSGELWTKNLIGKIWEKIEDYIPFINGADHALLVTGIDARDPNNVLVVVTDPGSGDLNKTYPIEQFVDAAKDSLFFMTVTDNPRPHVFDSYAQGNVHNLPQIGALTYEDFIKDYSIYFGSEKLMPSDVIEQYSSAILGKTYGYESNPIPAKDNFYPDVYQGDGNTCAIDAQMLVMRDYGIIIPKDDLINYAIEHGLFNPDPNPKKGGTPKDNVGDLLDACALTTKRTENATIYDIIAELRAGHRVIVSVDANELWIKNEPNLFKKLFGNVVNKVNDGIQNILDKEGANHALIVAGVNVNPDDPSDIKVTLIDTGSGKVCIEYKYEDYYDAWKDGNCLMISTQVPAPYQYNYQTDMIEPSGIETSFVPSQITLPQDLNNKFRLDESFYNYNLVPTYTYKNLLWNNMHTDYPELDSFMQRICLHDSHANNIGESMPHHINGGGHNDEGDPNVPLHQPVETHVNVNIGLDDITSNHSTVDIGHITTPETYAPSTAQHTATNSPIHGQYVGEGTIEIPGADLPGADSNGAWVSDPGVSEFGDPSSSDVNM